MKWVEPRASTGLETHPQSWDCGAWWMLSHGILSGGRCFDLPHHFFYHYQLDDVLGQYTTRQTNGRLATKMQNGGTWYRFFGSKQYFCVLCIQIYMDIHIHIYTYIYLYSTLHVYIHLTSPWINIYDSLLYMYASSYVSYETRKHGTDANYCSTNTDADYCLSISVGLGMNLKLNVNLQEGANFVPLRKKPNSLDCWDASYGWTRFRPPGLPGKGSGLQWVNRTLVRGVPWLILQENAMQTSVWNFQF